MRVLKFGGSSVAAVDRIKQVAGLVAERYAQAESLVVVSSAFGGVTDALIAAADAAAARDAEFRHQLTKLAERHNEALAQLCSSSELPAQMEQLQSHIAELTSLLEGVYLLGEASPRTRDLVLSFGERSSCLVLATALRSEGAAAEWVDAREVIVTDERFGAAGVDFEESNKNIRERLRGGRAIAVVTGFIGRSKSGDSTTLGRGGSDYTAAILGAGLNAEAIEIWTDVDGVLSADPRRVNKAFSIPKMSYAEAMEMSHFGAKVIYPPTIQPVLDKKIPLWIKNTFNPTHSGTQISIEGNTSALPVKGISSLKDVALVTVSGVGMMGVVGTAGRLFSALAQSGVNVILITQSSSEHSISFAVNPQDVDTAQAAVQRAFELEYERGQISCSVETSLCVIAIVGEGMRERPGISARLFDALGRNGINAVAIAQGSSELNVSVVVPAAAEEKALNALHEGFFLSDTRTVNIFMVGTGLIGNALLGQMATHAEEVRQRQGIELRLVGLSNSRKMLFSEQAIGFAEAQAELAQSETVADIGAFVEQMKGLNLSNSIFVDNTANAEVAEHYESILDASISISTPNKIATSSGQAQYERLKTIADKRNVSFGYETNVGAGLPVLTTLRDLLASGDTIERIEGVLSGSLSFIFNSFSSALSFSDAVLQAREKGYTEPDPRIDLMGLDVCRKLVILGRDAGWKISADDLKVDSILDESLVKAASIEDFLEHLPSMDGPMADRLATAEAEGQRLRMVGQVSADGGGMSLKALSSGHPFYGLSGADNMVVFYSHRYKERPLVVQGPGAGPEVTAAGVFAEIQRIANEFRAPLGYDT